jgi:hypothetical protein
MSAARILWAAVAAAVVVLLVRVGPRLWQHWQLVRALLFLSKGLEAGVERLEKEVAANLAAAKCSSEELVARIDDVDPFVRGAAASQLMERGVDESAHVQRLAEVLASPKRDRAVRVDAARALSGAGERARPHVVAVASLLDGADDDEATKLLIALETIGSVPDDVLAAVAGLLAASDHDEVRTEAVKVLAASHRDTVAVRTALLRALAQDAYVSVRAFAAIGLGWLPPDETTTRALEQARGDAESWVQTEADASLARQQNLGKMRPETPEQTASTTAYATGEAVSCSLGIGRFVGLTERQDRDGFTVRRLVVLLTTGRTTELPLACVGLRRVIARADAELLYARFFELTDGAPAPGAGDESARVREFAERIELLLQSKESDVGELFALRTDLLELAFVLERDEAELRHRLAERHPDLRDRIEGEPSHE